MIFLCFNFSLLNSICTLISSTIRFSYSKKLAKFGRTEPSVIANGCVMGQETSHHLLTAEAGVQFEFEVKRGSWNNPKATWELKFQIKLRAKGVYICINLKCIRYGTPRPASCGELKVRTMHQGRNLRVNLDTSLLRKTSFDKTVLLRRLS
jgi:hypothetical protein